jgi:uncharacterized protein
MRLYLLLFLVTLLTMKLTFAQQLGDVKLNTPTGTLYGTLLAPEGQGPFTVVLLHAGSGPTDRDGNSAGLPGKNNSLKLLAEGLAQEGIATLRFDKRGIAQSTSAVMSEDMLRFETYVDDAAAWLEFLRADSRFNKIAMLGHSEGSLIGILAAQKFPVDAYISIAGPGRPAYEILLEQLKPQLTPEQFTETERIVMELREGRTVANPAEQLPQELATALFRPSVQPYLISWFRYDPRKEIAKLTMPVLILQGTHDLQVMVADAELLVAANPKAELKLLEGMNHVFKTVSDKMEDNVASYSNPDLPLADSLVDDIAKFLK